MYVFLTPTPFVAVQVYSPDYHPFIILYLIFHYHIIIILQVYSPDYHVIIHLFTVLSGYPHECSFNTDPIGGGASVFT